MPVNNLFTNEVDEREELVRDFLAGQMKVTCRGGGHTNAYKRMRALCAATPSGCGNYPNHHVPDKTTDAA